MQRNKKTFKGQNIFIGIDVHKKNWQVSVITESGFTENLSIPSSAKALFEFLKRHYPEGTYRAVYESGFSGFATYYALTDLGIDCIVAHAADIPSTQYESAMKSDRIDAVRLAKALRAGLLKGIYVRPRRNLDDRSVVRLRKTFQIQLGGYKTRIKHLLHSNGVELPERFMRSGTHWSRAFMSWLRFHSDFAHSLRLFSSLKILSALTSRVSAGEYIMSVMMTLMLRLLLSLSLL